MKVLAPTIVGLKNKYRNIMWIERRKKVSLDTIEIRGTRE